MIVRMIVAGQETWHHNVVRAWSDGRYLRLRLDTHPSEVCFYLSSKDTSALICETDEGVATALREEQS